MSRAWTVIVYMAGDNGKPLNGAPLWHNLHSAGWRNLAEMSQVGSTRDVAVIVQYDSSDQDDPTRRLYIDGSARQGQLVERIPPTNTGDPKNLVECIAWAADSYPADRYALILWNHGSGWKEDDIYAAHRDPSVPTTRSGRARPQGRTARRASHALFKSSTSEILKIADDSTRGICYDDTSMDFLDNQKLATALAEACRLVGQRLSVLGMDACLMSMVEVAYQVSPYAEYLVSSQEIELADGWPYGAILGRLVQRPSMSAREFATSIVEEFGGFYMRRRRDGGGICTQSAINLSGVARTFEGIKELSWLVGTTWASDSRISLAMGLTRRRSHTFWDADYVDLLHFTKLLGDYTCDLAPVRGLAGELARHLEDRTPDGPIAANFRGSLQGDANGMSIYFPKEGCSPFYGRLAFRESGWGSIIARANGLEPGVG